MLKTTKEATDLTMNVSLRKVILVLFFMGIGVGIGYVLSNYRATAGEQVNFAAPEAMSASFAEIAKQVEPAVVNIDTKGKVPDIQIKGEKPGNNEDEDILDYLRRMPRRAPSAVGSGFIVDKQGYILTNFHVVDESSKIIVRLQNGEEYLAKIVGIDDETDLAVLKIDAGKDLPSVRLGDSNAAQVGDWVLAIGSPFGLAQTVTAGIISTTRRETPYATQFQKFIQTDAAVNRGNSGGPLVNMKGEVVGINSQIATSTGDYNGISFALPSNEASYVYQQILKNGKVRRGYLGVSLESVKPEFAKIYQLAEAKGAIIVDMRDKQSAAGLAGLLVNDIIVEFNGQSVESAQDLISKVAATEPGTEVTLTYLRETASGIERRTTNAKLGERPGRGRIGQDADADNDPPKKLGTSPQKVEIKPLGLTLLEVTPQLDTTFRLDGQKGLLVKEIDQSSFIVDIKNALGGDAIREGDLIQRINRSTVTELKSFTEIVSKLKTGDAVVLHMLSRDITQGRRVQRIVQFTIK